MLATMAEAISEAVRNNFAVPGFNIFGYEDAAAVIRAAESLRAPVILMANKDAVDHIPVRYFANLIRPMADDAKVPVCVLLDHAKEYGLIAQAIMSGFTAVMYDGSQLPLEENIRNTREVVKLAHACGVSVEAEIGSVGYTDAKMRAKAIYTDPSEAKIFAEQTGVDALAVAVGTLHRMQSQGANIQFDRLAAIREVVAVPLVIHGSTGVTDDDLARLAGYGVGKVNIGTALRMTFGRTIRQVMSDNPQEFDRIKMFKKPMQAVEAQAKNKFRILGFSGNA